MAIKKSEIYSQIWAACDKLRGGVEPARYKDYILTLLFVKYVSDRFKSSQNWDIEVPDGGSFDDLIVLKGKSHIGEGIDIVVSKLAETNGLKGIIDIASFNSDEMGTGQEMVDKLTDLISIFQKPELDFTNNRASGDDILGDAYEYLMCKFAQDSGKSKGQFYTPGEVSRIMAKLIGIDKAESPSMTVYDPACGSGSLLIRAADEAPCDISIFGQEKDKSTAGLARMNLVLHNKASGEIVGNKSTISSPFYKDSRNEQLLKTFDFIVVNPPFSDKSWMDGISIPDVYGRYRESYLGVPPEKNGDYAWMLHILTSLKSTGKAAVVLPHGVLFRGNAEENIRKKIIERGYITGIVGLPANIFFGTGIPACIIVIDKENASKNEGIFMIDASKGFIKDGNKNRLREQDIHKIVDTYLRKDCSDEKYARFVSNKEIEKNEYNLNIPRYINSTTDEDLQDINAHLNGGIPAVDIDNMENYWKAFPSLKTILFKKESKQYYSPKIAKEDIVKTIMANKEFLAHADKVGELFESWVEKVKPLLYNLKSKDTPKEVIKHISDRLLLAFKDVSLLDKYDVYQVLMDCWADFMQDDVYLISYDGYEVGRDVEYEYAKSKNNPKAKIKDFEGKLITKALIAKKYFPKEENALEKVKISLENLTSDIDSIKEEHSDEESLVAGVEISKAGIAKEISKLYNEITSDEIQALEEALAMLKDKNLAPSIPEYIKTRPILRKGLNAKGIPTRKSITDRIKAAKEEIALSKIANEKMLILDEIAKKYELESDLKKEIKHIEQALDEEILEKFKELNIGELKDLIVQDKWLLSIFDNIDTLRERISHNLSEKVCQLIERYENTLSTLEREVNDYESKVKSHLKEMGFVC